MQGMYVDPELARKLRVRYIRKPNFEKKGVLVAIVENGIVEVGFSMCHKMDKWDFVKGEHVRNFGLKVAIERADFWFTREKFSILERHINFITIPQTISRDLFRFIDKLKGKYPCKMFPMWAEKFVQSWKEGEE